MAQISEVLFLFDLPPTDSHFHEKALVRLFRSSILVRVQRFYWLRGALVQMGFVWVLESSVALLDV